MNDAVRQHLDEIKARIDVKQYAVDRFGVQIGQDGKSTCFMHDDSHPSLHFYSNGYHCFSCKGSGDAISLYQHFHPEGNFFDAINDASSFVGMPPCPQTGWTEDDQKRYKADLNERQEIYDIYMQAAEYYANVLSNYQFAKDEIKKRWGLTPEFYQKKKVGYAPAGRTNLIEYMSGKGISADKLVRAGLAKTRDGVYVDHFRGRIILPYWSGNKIIFMIGRWTEETPKKRVINKDTGEDEWVNTNDKYKKLLTWKDHPDCQVSRHVINPLYGIDALKDSKIQEIVITEGIADAMMAEQSGIPVVSPVTIRLKRQDCEQYADLFRRKSRVLIINDNEENRSGEMGALDIADSLEEAGCRVMICTIPRPEGVSKIDLADYLTKATDPKVAFDELRKTAKTALMQRILSIDSGADETERTEQVLSHRDSWCRVQPALMPGMMSAIQAHFNMSSKQRDALETSIKRIVKEEEKKVKTETEDSVRTCDPDLPLSARIAFELSSSEDMLEVTTKKAKDMIMEWLKNNGAKFFVWVDKNVGLIYFNKRLYEDGTTDYNVMMDEIASLNTKSRPHQMIMQYISNELIRIGKPIKDFSWIFTTDTGVKYLNLNGDVDDNLICLDPTKPNISIVPNASNEHNAVLRSPYFLKQIKYDDTVDIPEAMALFEKLIFENLACETRDKYLISAWSMLSLLIDELGTRPILQCTGSASSGKTTAAKLLSTLFFGEQRHEAGSTMAATNDLSSNVPCLYMDNQEQRNVGESLMDFLIASATKATRNKKGSADSGDIVQQSPNCMILLTSIEYFSRKELIERIFVVNFDEKHQKDSFSEGRILRSISQNRNKIMSAFLKIAHKVYTSLFEDDLFDLIEGEIRLGNPSNSKKRNMDALVYLTGFLREFCTHIHHNFQDIRFETSNSGHIHLEVLNRIIANQNASHMENAQDSSKINYFLNALEQAWDSKGIQPGVEGWDSSESHKVQEFLDKYLISFKHSLGVKYLLASYNDLHYAFSRISVPSASYEITSPANLRARIKDGYKIMMESGWFVGVNARRTSKDRLHVILRTQDLNDLTKLSAKFPDLKWLHINKG